MTQLTFKDKAKRIEISNNKALKSNHTKAVKVTLNLKKNKNLIVDVDEYCRNTENKLTVSNNILNNLGSNNNEDTLISRVNNNLNQDKLSANMNSGELNINNQIITSFGSVNLKQSFEKTGLKRISIKQTKMKKDNQVVNNYNEFNSDEKITTQPQVTQVNIKEKDREKINTNSNTNNNNFKNFSIKSITNNCKINSTNKLVIKGFNKVESKENNSLKNSHNKIDFPVKIPPHIQFPEPNQDNQAQSNIIINSENSVKVLNPTLSTNNLNYNLRKMNSKYLVKK
jgi:hypothetical protein